MKPRKTEKLNQCTLKSKKNTSQDNGKMKSLSNTHIYNMKIVNV